MHKGKKIIVTFLSLLVVVALVLSSLAYAFAMDNSVEAVKDDTSSSAIEYPTPNYFVKDNHLSVLFNEATSESALCFNNNPITEDVRKEFSSLVEATLKAELQDSFNALVEDDTYRNFIEIKDPKMLALFKAKSGVFTLINGVNITIDPDAFIFFMDVVRDSFIDISKDYPIEELIYFDNSTSLKSLKFDTVKKSQYYYAFEDSNRELGIVDLGGKSGFYVDDNFSKVQVRLFDSVNSKRVSKNSFYTLVIPIMYPVAYKDFTAYGFVSFDNLELKVSDNGKHEIYDPIGKYTASGNPGIVTVQGNAFNLNHYVLLNIDDSVIAVPAIYTEAFSVNIQGVDIQNNISRYVDITDYLLKGLDEVTILDSAMSPIGKKPLDAFNNGGVFNITKGKKSLYFYYAEAPTDVLIAFSKSAALSSLESSYPGITKDFNNYVKARKDYKDTVKAMNGSVNIIKILVFVLFIALVITIIFIIKKLITRSKKKKMIGELFKEDNLNNDNVKDDDSDNQLF